MNRSDHVKSAVMMLTNHYHLQQEPVHVGFTLA